MHNRNRFARWIIVQAYKHDGKLHRQWSPSYIVEETDQYWALASRMSLVTESNGRKWMTKEPAIFILFKEAWMNVIAMFKPQGGICYYVNIASPTILDKGFLKYIDYDLDVKLFPDRTEKMLDEYEFQRNAEHYGYPPELRQQIIDSQKEVVAMCESHAFPFVDEDIRALYQRFLDENKPVLNR